VGGIAPRVSELSEALAERGHEVHVFTKRGDFDAYNRINGVYYQRVNFDNSGSLIKQMDRMSAAMYECFLMAKVKLDGNWSKAALQDAKYFWALENVWRKTGCYA
jgi:Glycosyltransferase Family 4